MLRLYAVVIRDYSVVYVEYYWAEDRDHAKAQAIDVHPMSRYDAVSLVPYVEPRDGAPIEGAPGEDWQQLLREACLVIEDLADQRAIPDPSWKEKLAGFRDAINKEKTA
jgi:hypothetical protein